MQIEGRNIYDLPIDVDYRTLSKSIFNKTGITILKCKDMIFEKLSDTEKVATIDCTQYRNGDCRVTIKELLNGWKPAWEKQNIKVIKEENNIVMSNEATKLHSLFKDNYRDPKYCHRDKFISGLTYTYIKKNGFDDNTITELLNSNIVEQYDNDAYRLTQEAIKDFMSPKIKNEQNKTQENIICETYFKVDDKIINGWKVLKCNDSYDLYIYTSCKKLNNWQLFLTFDDKERMLRYFKNRIENTSENLEINWCKTEHEWIKNTYDILNKKIS
jgi:hypothetical protein